MSFFVSLREVVRGRRIVAGFVRSSFVICYLLFVGVFIGVLFRSLRELVFSFRVVAVRGVGLSLLDRLSSVFFVVFLGRRGTVMWSFRYLWGCLGRRMLRRN